MRDWERGVRPFLGSASKQARPALAPVLATQASEFLALSATVAGNSPRVSTGLPTMVSCVGSSAEMVIIVRVLDPALTATSMLPSTLSADWLKRASGAAGSLVLPSIPEAPLPPVEVMEPSERVPSAATFIATTEFPAASLVSK